MLRVVLSVTNDLVTEQRVHKMALSLMALGCEVLVVGRMKKNSPQLVEKPYSTHRIPVFFEKGKLFYLEYNLKLLCFLLFVKVDILTANDLDTLLPNFIVSKLRKKRLIYDSHEYFTDVPELIRRPFTRRMWLILEQLLFPKLDKIATVSEWIAQTYQQKYKKFVKVIKNYPKHLNNSTIPSTISNIILYQGAVNEGRELGLVIESMRFLEGYILWIVGEGDKSQELQKLSAQLGVNERVKFWGRVPFEELGKYTSQAAIGVHLVNPESLNYAHSLPNKLFDYLQFSLPIIATDLPEMREVVLKNNVGILLNKPTPDGFAEAVKEMMNDTDNYLKMRQNAALAAEIYTWEGQKQLIKELYDL